MPVTEPAGVSKERVMVAGSIGFKNIIGQQKAFSQDMPLPSKNTPRGELPLSHRLSDKSATVRQGIFIYDQFPEPLPSAVGSTEVFVYKHVTKVGTAIMHKKTFKEHFSAPLKSKLGTTHVQVFRSIISQMTAIPHKKAFIRDNYPEPLPSKIGEEDLPGGFKREGTMTGQKNPLYDFARGIVQIDGVKVLFDVQG